MATALRRPLHSLLHPSFRRSFYSKRAEFTNIDAQGSPVTQEVDVWLGEPHEAYVIVPKNVGNALKAACRAHAGSSLAAEQDTYPLTFDHVGLHFANNATPFPRLVIPQDLPRQSSAATSPATLFIFGPTDTIALNGTQDFEFAKQSGESFRRLKPSLDNLKNR